MGWKVRKRGEGGEEKGEDGVGRGRGWGGRYEREEREGKKRQGSNGEQSRVG